MSEKPTYEELGNSVSERLLSDVFNSIQDGISILNTDLTIRRVNNVMKQWYVENLPLEGKKCYECYHNSDEPCDPCPTIRCIKSGQTEREIVPGLSGSTVEWIELFSYPIKDQISGEVIGVVEFVRDITEQKQAEKALQKSEEQLRKLLQNIKAAVVVHDSDTKILRSNKVAQELLGLTEDQLLGKKAIDPDWKFIREDGSIMPFEEYPVNQVLEKKLPLENIIGGIYRPDIKDTKWVLINANPLFDDYNRISQVIVTFMDITDRRKAEEEKKNLEARLQQAHKMESIGTIAGGIAHDFNNILGIILGNTELAMDDMPEWNPARVNLDEIKIASLRAKDVVRQLLSFARKTDQKRKPVKINPIVTDVLKLLRSSIPTSIEIRSKIPKESPIIFADPTQINQVMINLCINAAQAMEEDGGILEISLDSMTLDESTAQPNELSPGQYVKLTVNDTGHGIAPEIKHRIFDPYFTTREFGKGSGMGLAVVHGIVMNHDGAITVESEVGKGTTFNLFFPIVSREPVPELTIDEDLPAGKERILFVDDEESIVKIGSQRLKLLGYQVESTTSPLDALDLFRSKPDQFDLVITDLTMPKMTGDKLAKEILNIRPEMPIIICTGFNEKMDRNKAREIGAAGYLEKPHEKRSLARMVRKVLERKES